MQVRRSLHLSEPGNLVREESADQVLVRENVEAPTLVEMFIPTSLIAQLPAWFDVLLAG